MSAAPIIPDLSSYETFVNGFPHGAFVQLREHAPVWWHEPTERTPDGEGFWCVSTHELVVEVFRNPRIYSSHTGGDRPYGGTMINDMEMSGKLLNMMDDPRHQRIRRLVSKGFTPKRIARLRGELEAISERTLDSVAPGPGARGTCDLVVDVAAELPLQAICLLMGAPGEDRHSLCEWVDVTSSDFSDEVPRSVRAEASVNLFQYGQRLIAARTAEPRDDLLSVFCHAEKDGAKMTRDQMRGYVALLLVGGGDTTHKAIDAMWWNLLRNYEQYEAVREDPELMDRVFTEMLRFDGSNHWQRRRTKVEVEIHGRVLPVGATAWLGLGSGNRDERIFKDPESFNIFRDDLYFGKELRTGYWKDGVASHLGFGQETHFCLGYALARQESVISSRILLDRLKNPRLADVPNEGIAFPPPGRGGVRGLQHLEIDFDL